MMMQSYKKKVTVKLFESKSRYIYLKILIEASINGVYHSTSIQTPSIVAFDHPVRSNMYVLITTH